MKKIAIIIAIILAMPITLGLTTQITDTEPRPVQSGNYADITVLFENTIDQERENVKVYLESTDDIRVIAGQDYTINRMRIGDAFTRTFRVYIAEDLPTGNIPLKIVMEEDGVVKESIKELQIRKGESMPNIKIGSISATPSDIIKDSERNQITLTLQNRGDRVAKGIVATLESGGIEQSSAFSLRDTAASLTSDNQEELQFTFDVKDTDISVLDMTLNLEYTVEDVLRNNVEISESINFEVGMTKTPDIKVIETRNVNEAKVGQSGNKVEITLQNTGEEAKNVRVRLYPDVSYPLDFERTSFYVSSTMRENETTTFEIDFDALANANVKQYPINIEIESMVGENRYFQDERINIDITGEANDLATTVRNFILSLSLIIAIGFGVNSYRKKH